MTDPGRTAGTAPSLEARTLDVVLVGAGERASAWLPPLLHSARLRVIATVARGEPLADLPRLGSLDDAMQVHPAAVFAVALPPRAALEAALRLAADGRSGMVEAPLHDALLDSDLGTGASHVRVAHGWVTLPGARVIQALMRRAGGGRLQLEVAGLPEEDGGDTHEQLVHAAALAQALLPGATALAVRQDAGGGLEVELVARSSGSEWTGLLRVVPRGRRLAVRVETGGETALWSWHDDSESVMLGRVPLVSTRATPPAPVRALAQLLADANRGDGLVEAAAALRLAQHCLTLLPSRLPIGQRPLRQSASIARRRPFDQLARLGLRGVLPTGGPPPRLLSLEPPPEPFELWGFRAGVKPLAFLTVHPGEVEATLAWFGNAHCERRDRRVHIAEQDRWIDRRNEGEQRVELYIARDPEAARRMASLQADEDPSRSIRDLGALCGYPPCCVEAFARQDDRANNTRNRYYGLARSLASDGSTPPWPWALNNLHTMVAPFYPCSYRCKRALSWARACIAEMAREHPVFVEELRSVLGRPVLYFDHDHQLVLEGEYVDGWVAFRSVAHLPSAPPQLAELAAAIGLGNRLSLDDRHLVVARDGEVVLRLDRTDPALGFVAPFGRTSDDPPGQA